MKIYIDEDFKCHTAYGGGMRNVETDFFEGKCQRFIEGFRFVPEGECWRRTDGELFKGEMISPWKNYEMLVEIQEQYEENQEQITDMQAALDTVYSGVTE